MKVACRELSNQEVFARIQEVVHARFPAIEQEFKKADPARTKLVSKQDFRDICNRRFLLLTDEQVKTPGGVPCGLKPCRSLDRDKPCMCVVAGKPQQ